MNVFILNGMRDIRFCLQKNNGEIRRLMIKIKRRLQYEQNITL